jgi:TonB family protein
MSIRIDASSVVASAALAAVLLAGTGIASQVVAQETSPEAQRESSVPAVFEPARPTDPERLARALTERYPVRFEERGIGGTVRVRAHVSAEGRADAVHVTFSSGVSQLDHVATAVARGASFHPARDSTGPVGSWVELSLLFGVDAERGADEFVLPAERAAIEERVQPYAPADLRRGRIEVPVVVILAVAEDGSVSDAVIPTPECFPSAMTAALAAARELRFEPAGESDAGPRTTVATFHFDVDGVRVRILGDSDPPPRPPAVMEDPGSVLTEATGPRLRNTRSVREEMRRRYPDHLRRMGLGGSVRVSLFVDERGRVSRRRLAETSGDCDLDRAAIEVARVMRFTPATRDGKAVPVWLAIPLTFTTSDR